jgi:hypothetical protein
VEIAMATLTINEVISLINHNPNVHVDAQPSMAGTGYDLYTGHYAVHVSRFNFRTLYFKASATKANIEQAAREVSSRENLHIVYAPSLEDRSALLRELFRGEGVQGPWSVKRYLMSFLEQDLERYTGQLRDLAPKYYIDPPIEVPFGVSLRTANPLINLLRDPMDQGSVGIMLAEPGQGKTYMSKYLVSKLAAPPFNLLPIYIDSEQWARLSPEDLGSLERTIMYSFRHYDTPIAWVEGCEDQFLNTTLKAGEFRIVFDGFDEYILRNRGSIRPLEVISNLLALAEQTGVRILITSRTTFWSMNVSDQELAGLGDKVYIYTILPFNLDHARNYFGNRLKDQKKQQKATDLFGRLRSKDEEFVGRGFVLDLIADLVERYPDDQLASGNENSALRWLIAAFCDREERRQKLPLSGEDQRKAFIQFAAEMAVGTNPDSDTLWYCLGTVRGDIKESEKASLLGDPKMGGEQGKLRSHPLLEYCLDSDTWAFKQPQAFVLLLAEYLISINVGAGNSLTNFAAQLKINPETRQDLAGTLVALARLYRSADDNAIGLLRKIIGGLRGGATTAVHGDAPRLGASVLLAAVDRLRPKGSVHQDRTTCLLSLVHGAAVVGLTFTGTVARFDLAGVQFSHCIFENVTWANCTFDGSTRFDSCSFVGGACLYSPTFGQSEFTNCQFDQDARVWVSNAVIESGKRAYSADNLRDEIASVIVKFITKSGAPLKSVAQRNLTSGPISVSKQRDRILSVLKSLILDEHTISGTTEPGFHIRVDARDSVASFIANNVFTGPLAQAEARLKRDLGLQ